MTSAHGDEHESPKPNRRPASPARDPSLSFLKPAQRTGSLGRLQHYEVLAILERGGFGIVFKAFDERLRRPVAIKVLNPDAAASPAARKRFLREARATAAVHHDNVVQIFAVEEKPVPFLVMEFVEGETLQQRIDRQGPFQVTDLVEIGRQIAAGLSAAHAKGLIHRDIKPANILFDQRVNRPKIMDFGLALVIDDAHLTQSGAVLGTPLYMSPEQARGEPVDARSDLFSLGSVLYVMATGIPPFQAPSTLAVLKRVADDAPRAIRELLPDHPAGLISLIEKLHAKAPAERVTSAADVERLLLEGEFPRIPPDRADRDSGSMSTSANKRDGEVVRTSAVAQGTRRAKWTRTGIGAVFVVSMAVIVFGLMLRKKTVTRAAVQPEASDVAVAAEATTDDAAGSVPAAARLDLPNVDPIIGRWRVQTGPEMSLHFVTTFNADGTTETRIPPGTLAELRRRNLPSPPQNPDRGRWARISADEYKIDHGNGRSFTLQYESDHYFAMTAGGDPVVAWRVDTSDDPDHDDVSAGPRSKAIVGRWRISFRNEKGFPFHVLFREDGTSLTTLPPESLAEARRKKVPRERTMPKEATWSYEGEGRFRHIFAPGRSTLFNVFRNRIWGTNGRGEALVGERITD